ncbi:N-acyl-D-amino-acid deacylase family protein [Clostridium sp. HV4-5-A1G]|jgi:N-acyl-D-amino-acid deacylase|uniref:N-acyl-D-amino-acid deacylase family protein n=1 Tax=Clostridium sp. HV4-5-A1G TaxID=2004595 RepID=UPI00123A3BCD|nr:D-aminoacylase [Clostridium sp. HV4-5-A1G]KAA8679377.1 D-aminoacylase [Clostridium sp. HV4-5-A1G]
MLNILIKNGLVVDGTGNDAYNADIGILDDKIVEISENIHDSADKIIDASGLIVAPGFIDVHSHNDLVTFMSEKIRGLKLMQGVTTELVGQCGLGVVPCVHGKDRGWKSYIKGVVGDPDLKWSFHDVDEYMDKISSRGLKNNYGMLISQGAVRVNTVGFSSKIPDTGELQQMCDIVEDAMKKGAFGMSLGLQYVPGIFSREDELIALCRVVEKYDGIVMVHVRNHDNTMKNALREIIDIALRSGVRLQVSHMRSYASKELGCSAGSLIEIVEKAVKAGVNITFDEHLYLSGSTLMTQLLPPWITEKGKDRLIDMLKDEKCLDRVKSEIEDTSVSYAGWDNYSAVAGWDGILITSVKKPGNLKYIGKTVGEISRDLNVHPVDFIAGLIIEENAGVGIVTLNIFSEEDTLELIKHPLQMVGSDSIPAGVPHPRLYGNYPLFIGKFIRDKKVLSLEQGIYKCTLFPAVTLGLKDRGKLAEGKTADITVFDFDEIEGYEDYNNSRKEPAGIKYVVLNGKVAVENGNLCKRDYGRVIRHCKCFI